jgi:hypothetical protein
MYWRRPSIWEQCLRQVLFSPFVVSLRSEFDDLLQDPKRTQSVFSLSRWEFLVDKEQFDDEWFFPAGIAVRQTGETFRVTSYLQLTHVRADKKEGLRVAATSLRRGSINRRLSDEQSWVALRRRKDLSLEGAVEFASEQLRALQLALESVRLSVVIAS